MKSQSAIILMATAAFLVLIPLAITQTPIQRQPFSADVQFTSTGEGGMKRDTTGKMYFAAEHLRRDMQVGPRGGSIIITDFKTQTTDILIPAKHMYMEYKASEMQGHGPAMMLRPLRDPSNPCAGEHGATCKNLGVEQINGRTCDHWQITDKNGQVANVWIDRKIHFPIKTVAEDSTWMLTNIKESEPAASLFQIPAGYTKMDVGSMMQKGRPPQP